MSLTPDWFNLEGRVALVTGASRGIGKAIARALAGAGAAVCLASRSEEQARAAAAEIAAGTGARAFGLAADVARSDEVERMLATVLETFGRIDMLVNNAGAGLVGHTVEFSDADWATVLRTNLDGAFYGCRAAALAMIERGEGGRILNIASILADVGRAGFAAYCASKAGMVGLTKALALEWAPHRITVNALCPGFIPTEMTRGIKEAPNLDAAITARIPLARWGREDEAAAAALYLVSEPAAYVTGTVLVVDGGWTAQ